MVKGLMIESYLEDGSQPVNGTVYGQSITDPCLGWDKTERLIHELAEMVQSPVRLQAVKIENLEKGCKKFSNILNFVFTNRSDLYIIIEYEIERFLYAPLAQLDRVAHYECEGWGFESLMAHQVQ